MSSDKPVFGPTTALLHADRARGTPFGAIHEPVHGSVQYGYDRVEDLIDVFQGKSKNAFVYARQGTPTTAALESRLAQMEGGVGYALARPEPEPSLGAPPATLRFFAEVEKLRAAIGRRILPPAAIEYLSMKF